MTIPPPWFAEFPSNSVPVKVDVVDLRYRAPPRRAELLKNLLDVSRNEATDVNLKIAP